MLLIAPYNYYLNIAADVIIIITCKYTCIVWTSREKYVRFFVCACVCLVPHASEKSIYTHSFYGEERIAVAGLNVTPKQHSDKHAET